jgi:hypothetical protein
LYRKAAEQGVKEAKAKLDEIESAAVDRRDPDDVVAQVLNYTAFGKDDGLNENYWFKEPGSNCRYTRHSSLAGDRMSNQLNSLRPFLGMGAIQQRRIIDLDTLDPKNITFRYGGVQTMLGDNVVGTVVEHADESLFIYAGKLDIDRLQRGWTLIYSKYCSGREKPF